ncbi:MAG: ATP-binding cassette domain-containing protein [Myxococcales bacterium]|nr:ATP-binding cassette domain-containing protein [Myxococcales bacterium]
MLKLDRVSKRFNTVRALTDVTVEFERGCTTVLIGSSGSGKSTALKMLNALVRPDEGRVLFEGQQLANVDVHAVRRRMGYVIQGGGLFPHLSARDNVCLLARHLGHSADAANARLKALIAMTHLPMDVLDRYPQQLSGGQQQRIALMRALMLKPEVLLLDEPLGALDPLVRAELQLDLKRIFSELGTTVALVTHDLAEAALLGDHVALFHEGEVLQQGPMRALVESPQSEMVRRFVEAQRGMLRHLEGAH